MISLLGKATFQLAKFANVHCKVHMLYYIITVKIIIIIIKTQVDINAEPVPELKQKCNRSSC